jgi:actin-binding protein IPP
LYLCRNYSKLIDTGHVFLTIDFDFLYNLLTDDNLYLNSEFEIFDSILKWLSFDYDIRGIHAKQLLDLIRTSYLKSIKLYNYLNNIQCYDLKITIAKYLYEKFEVSNSFKTIEEPRKYLRKSILVFGGVVDTLTSRLNNKVYCFDTANQRLFSLSGSFLKRSNHCVCEFNDLIFVSGGEINLSISDLVEIYDLDHFRRLIKDYYSNSHLQTDEKGAKSIQSMLQARTDFAMCTIDDKLYVFGGWIGSDVGNSIECYTPIENKWFQISTMPTLRYDFACVALKNSNFIYLIGGTTPFETKLSLVECFNVSTLKWELCASMNEKRTGCACTVFNERIYVFGGFNGRSVLSSVEVYDPINVNFLVVILLYRILILVF